MIGISSEVWLSDWNEMELPSEVEIGKLILRRTGHICLYDGKRVHLPGQRHDLVMLLAQAFTEGRVLGNDELCIAIWEESGRHGNLRQAASSARRDLEGTGIKILNKIGEGLYLEFPN